MKRLLASLLCLLPLSCPADSASTALPSPSEVPAAEAWSRFLTEARSDAVIEAIGLIDTFYAEVGVIDPDVCATQAAALARALQQAPISLAVWHTELECAGALGEDARAENALTAFAALSRHALSRNPLPGSGDPPMPALNESDAWLMAGALQREVLHAYYRLPLHGPYLQLQMAVYDPEEEREQIWVFDVVDTWRQLMLRDGTEDSPAFAAGFRQAVMASEQGEWDSSPGGRLGRLSQAFESGGMEGLPDRLAALASEDFGAARALFTLCITRNPGHCSEAAVDALLPYAEAGSAEPLWLLALAYSEGQGVPRDDTAAARLLDRADGRLGGALATHAAAREWLLHYRRPSLPPLLDKRLEALADSGDQEARELLLVQDMNALAEGRPSARKLKRVAAAAEARDLRIRSRFALLQIRSGDLAGRDALRSLAAAGEASAALALLQLSRGATQTDTLDPETLIALHRLAGQHGAASSSSAVALHLLQQGKLAAAQEWFASAFIQGDVDAGYHAAELALQSNGAFGGTPHAVARLLEAVLARKEHIGARRMLAGLLLMGGFDLRADPERAGDLLRENQHAEDAESGVILGSALLRNQLPAQPGESGEAILRGLVDAGNPGAMDTLALHIVAGQVQAPNSEALALWRRAADSGYLGARNNLAWTLCTAVDDDLRDPAAGLEEALVLAEQMPADAYAYHDTVATCHAAAGDFDTAIEQLESQIAAMRTEGIPDEAIAYHEAKLEQFRRRERYIEDPRRGGPMATDPAPAADEKSEDATPAPDTKP